MDTFWHRVRIGKDNDCWEWLGAKSPGRSCVYGHVRYNKKVVSAHRVAWILTYGEIPTMDGYHGACVMHKCDNPLCCNPKHLRLGSNSDNIKDRDLKGRQVTAHGVEHKLSKLTDAAVRDIRETYERGSGGRNLNYFAAKYGVSAAKISQVLLNKSWQHIR